MGQPQPYPVPGLQAQGMNQADNSFEKEMEPMQRQL